MDTRKAIEKQQTHTHARRAAILRLAALLDDGEVERGSGAHATANQRSGGQALVAHRVVPRVHIAVEITTCTHPIVSRSRRYITDTPSSRAKLAYR